ncbi:hypothetical protein HY641_01520 [Candidatus Woesearchaeota archaeon]|nr:hypothetical protein [Candidatus Woesearchaeota archaeon]
MTFSTIITIPSTPTLSRLLATQGREDRRSQTVIVKGNTQVIITITAKDFTSLRASTNIILQTIAVHNTMTEA